MNYELTKLEEITTWSEMDHSDIPQEAQILPGMWVHLIKNLELGDQKFRSHWVVQGDKQRPNLSLSETFAPASQIASFQILLHGTSQWLLKTREGGKLEQGPVWISRSSASLARGP